MDNIVLFVAVSFFFFKQKTAYEMRISDWSSDVCSSDLPIQVPPTDAQSSSSRSSSSVSSSPKSSRSLVVLKIYSTFWSGREDLGKLMLHATTEASGRMA